MTRTELPAPKGTPVFDVSHGNAGLWLSSCYPHAYYGEVGVKDTVWIPPAGYFNRYPVNKSDLIKARKEREAAAQG